MNLFQYKPFVSAAGIYLDWKIECDALTKEDWESIARISYKSIPSFKFALGVPEGGIFLAYAIDHYANRDAEKILIVDDVWTTGSSMQKYAANLNLDNWIGFVAFSRGKLPDNVYCFLQFALKDSNELLKQ